MEVCDACGTNAQVRAKWVAIIAKEFPRTLKLTLCAHCMNVHRAQLKEKGWTFAELH